MIKNYKVSWTEYIKLIEKMACEIKHSPKLKNISFIYGIPRAGNIISTILSYKLDIPLLTEEPRWAGVYMENHDNNRILIVDDIIDEGSTISPFVGDNFYTAILYVKNKPHNIKPDFIGKSINAKQWIIMPYDPPMDTVSRKTQDYYKKEFNNKIKNGEQFEY